MQYRNLVTSFVRSWNFTRSETLEILNSLTDKKLQYKPKGEDFKPLYFQFGCIARTQLVYARAVKTGFMDFSLFSSTDFPKKDQYQTIEEIKELLEKADKVWTQALRDRREEEDFTIKWPGFNQPLPVHIQSLIAHERLHHGQFITYFTLAGFKLPVGFKGNWAL